MTRDILTTCEGWTPVIDILAQELGLMTAVVYGVVWRYCQMRSGVCYASMSTLAEQLGISRHSILRHLKRLCEAGFLEDVTPSIRNKPHTYRDTAKVELRGSVTVVVGRCSRELHQDEDGVAGSYTDSCSSVLHEDTKDTITTGIEERIERSPREEREAEARKRRYLGKYADVVKH